MDERITVKYTVPDPRRRPEFEHVFPDRKTECRDKWEAKRLVEDLKRDGYRNVRIEP